MKLREALLSLAAILTGLCSCDDNTDNLGGSIIDDLDNMKVSTQTFNVVSRSVKADSVYSRTSTGYLGRVKDPETGAFIKGNFLTQFYTLEGTQLPEENTIESRLADGSIIADSCVVYLYYDKYFGDSLSTMKLHMTELAKPMEEKETYYSDFNPQTADGGYCRTDGKGISVGKTYALYDLAADTVPKKIKIKLPNSAIGNDGNINGSYAYTDRDGKGYYNYGTYLMQKYYQNPKLYKNAYSFIHNVCPGFYFKTTDGIGSMAYINMSQMLVYYKYRYEKTASDGTKKDTVANVVTTFAGTEEVIQSTQISNDETAINSMVADGSGTFIKSPAGIYTELTIPVDDILNGYESDTINSARISLQRINNRKKDKYSLPIPKTLLLVPTALRTQFFENGKITDNKLTYTAVFASDDQSGMARQNCYTFHNVANLIQYMKDVREKGVSQLTTGGLTTAEAKQQWESIHNDWNRVMIVPVETTYVTIGQSSQLVKVANDMSISGTKFAGGSSPEVKIEVVYSKFEKK